MSAHVHHAKFTKSREIVWRLIGLAMQKMIDVLTNLERLIIA
jgi:predicted DNA-binding protein (UPF0251 family)